MQRTIEFTKMHGAGNDYIYVNTLVHPINNPEALAAQWSDRHKGIGGDGLVLIGPSDKADFSMRIFNNDGSEARMCGNATRCVGKYVHDNGLTDKLEVSLETLSGIKIIRLHAGKDGLIDSATVDMGAPSLDVPTQFVPEKKEAGETDVTATTGIKYHGLFVSMGNPHFVIFTTGVEELDVAGIGPTLEFANAFPERCNIEFAEVRPDNSIRMRVWERGSGITLACGTGACATAVAATITGRSGRESDIVMDGGTLHILWDAGNGHIFMTGPATKVFDGCIDIDD